MEDGGNLANFDQTNNSIVVPDNLAAYLTKAEHRLLEPRVPAVFNACNLNQTCRPCTKYVTASQDGLPQGLRQTYKGNFQPRSPSPIARSTTPRPSFAAASASTP